jgi:hypothetical protein
MVQHLGDRRLQHAFQSENIEFVQGYPCRDTCVLPIWFKVNRLRVFLGLDCNFWAIGPCTSSQNKGASNMLSFRSRE